MLKQKLIQELMDHVDGIQAKDLLALLDKARGAPEMDEMGKPKGIKVEKVELMGKPEKELPEGMEEDSPEHEAAETPEMEKAEHGQDEMTDEEIKEMLAKLIK